jgi:cytochrome P450
MTGYTPLEAGSLSNPLPMYARLRDQGPVQWDETIEGWLCPDYDECSTVMTDIARFAKDPRRAGWEVPDSVLSIMTIDPPDNRVVRQAIVKLLRAYGYGPFGQQVAREADRLLRDSVEDGLDTDLTRDFAEPLALNTMTTLLGLDPIDPRFFASVSERLVRGMDLDILPEAAAPATVAREELSELLHGQLSSLRGKDCVGGQLLIECAGVDEAVVVNSLRVLFHAGYSTLCRALENATAMLVGDPELQRAFVSVPSGATDAAVNELMRFDSPQQADGRLVVEDTELAGQALKRGDYVVVLIGSANHDQRHFADPGSVRLDRSPNPHLSFGRGPHSCIGGGVAVSALSSALPRLFRDPDRLVTGAAAPVRRDNASLRGFASIPARIPAGR